MSASVTVVDYGAGNLLNVVRALEHCGASVTVTTTPEPIANATRLILPGVGAFADCMEALRERQLIQPIQDYIRSGRPFLGICVGMQVMFEVGEEFGEHAGLGIIPGRVSRIPNTGANGLAHKIPHIGWQPLEAAAPWENTLLEGIGTGAEPAVYFVHSYRGMPVHPENTLATVDYNGISICATVRSGNAYGVQFHPEKSGEIGLSILRNFLTL